MFSPNNGRYIQIGKDIETMVNLGKYIYITIYSTQDGSTIATDGNGNSISHKILSSIGYTYADETIPNGFITIKFTDGVEFNAYDDVQTFWYFIDELSTTPTALV